MTTSTVPVYINDRVHQFPPELAAAVAATHQKLDSMSDEDEDEEEEEDEDETKADFLKRMAKAKAKVAGKNDSLDPDDVIDQLVDRIDSLESEKKDSDAQKEVLAAMIQQQPHEDADDEYEDEEMDDLTPEEIATERIAAFMKAKPFLRPEAQITDYGDIYDIFEDAIGTRYPNAFGIAEDGEDDGMGDYRIDPDDADELRGAFYLMCLASNPMQRTPTMALDSKDADRAFSQQLGMRSDSLTPVMPAAPTLKPLY
jgi:hypothetical protein